MIKIVSEQTCFALLHNPDEPHLVVGVQVGNVDGFQVLQNLQRFFIPKLAVELLESPFATVKQHVTERVPGMGRETKCFNVKFLFVFLKFLMW